METIKFSISGIDLVIGQGETVVTISGPLTLKDDAWSPDDAEQFKTHGGKLLGHQWVFQRTPAVETLVRRILNRVEVQKMLHDYIYSKDPFQHNQVIRYMRSSLLVCEVTREQLLFWIGYSSVTDSDKGCDSAALANRAAKDLPSPNADFDADVEVITSGYVAACGDLQTDSIINSYPGIGKSYRQS